MPAEQPRVYPEDYWRAFLTNGDTLERRLRIVFKHLPSEPRCHLCAAPFSGPGGAAMRLIGKKRAAQNPNTCGQCFSFISTHHGGAEIAASMLFADIRGSTTIAEGMSPTESGPCSTASTRSRRGSCSPTTAASTSSSVTSSWRCSSR